MFSKEETKLTSDLLKKKGAKQTSGSFSQETENLTDSQEISEFVLVKNSIASNKKELSKFILDLCSFTLEKAGFDPKVYPFYMHVAFRHQITLHAKEWEELCDQVDKIPLTWGNENKERRDKIVEFAQAIVTEVNESAQDKWAVRLIKTSYLSQLDRARKNCEQAIKVINLKDGQHIEDMSISSIPPGVESTEEYTEALQAYIAYLDSLAQLPFVMEKICLKLAENTGYNYQPRKAAEMLAASIDTINAALLIDDDNDSKKALFEGLTLTIKLALKITNPELPVDAEVIKAITEELETFNTLIQNAKTLREKEKLIFPQGTDTDLKTTQARKQMFAAIGVNFYSLTDILSATLLEPVKECRQAVIDGTKVITAVNNAIHDNNSINRIGHISEAFKDFDSVVSVCSELDQSLLPPWLKQANGYYQRLKKEASKVAGVANTALNGLGAFYNYAISFIPVSVQSYLSSKDALTTMLNEISTDSSELFQIDKVMAYFAFYELAEQGKIEEPVKAKLFSAYMDEVVKAEPALRKEEFSYEKYSRLATQLKDKIKLEQTLEERINGFGADIKCSESLNTAVQETLHTDPQKLEMLALINRLQILEREFNVNEPQAIFDELVKAQKALQQFEPLKEMPGSYKALGVFGKEFLQPAIQRMLTRYQNEKLVPLVEEMLDSHDEKLKSDAFALRKIYGKLKGNLNLSSKDLDRIKVCWEKYTKAKLADQLANQFARVKILTDDLGKGKKQKLAAPLPKTAKEMREVTANHTLDKMEPIVEDLLNKLQEKLEDQKKSCGELEKLANNQNITEVCNGKIQYIEALQSLITSFQDNFKNKNSDLRNYLGLLLKGEVKVFVDQGKQRLDRALSVPSIAKGLFHFAWDVLPTNENGEPVFDEELITNLIKYYIANNDINNVLDGAEAYSASLEKNPALALMKELSDPLAIANIFPSQEKVMDAIVDNIIEVGRSTAFSWGTNVLKQAVSKLTLNTLTSLLPYPFLADLALQALQSDVVQTQVARIVNPLISEYGDIVSDTGKELKEAAKNRLYPILGIEIQKKIESGAYKYVKNPSQASETDCDSFAMYYLQYRQIKRTGERFNEDGFIKFLFRGMLKNKEDGKKQTIIANIKQKFADIDTLFTESDTNQNDNNLLKEHINLANRLLIMMIDASTKLNGNVQNELQRQVVEDLTKVVKKIKKLPNDEQREMTLALNEAVKRANKMKLDQVKSSLEQTKLVVQKQVDDHKAMLNSDEPLLGLSVIEWEYKKSTFASLLVTVFSILLDSFSFLSTWASIITPIVTGGGFLQALLIAFGLSGAIGASATGFGAAAVAAAFLTCLSIKFGIEIWRHKNEIKAINKNPSIMERIGPMSLLLLKCFGLALAKTILTDYLFAKVSTLLAFSSWKSIRDSFRAWPKRETVEEEQLKLTSVTTGLDILQKLIDKQIDFIAGEKDPQTNKPVADQSEAITVAIIALRASITDAQKTLQEISSNDARYTYKNYEETLTAYTKSFENLNNQIKELQRMQSSLPKVVVNDEDVSSNKKASVVSGAKRQDEIKTVIKPVIVDLEVYKRQLGIVQKESEPQMTQPGYISSLLNWVRPATVETHSQGNPDIMMKSVNEGSFFMMPRESLGQSQQEDTIDNNALMQHSLASIDSMLESIVVMRPSKKEENKTTDLAGNQDVKQKEEVREQHVAQPKVSNCRSTMFSYTPLSDSLVNPGVKAEVNLEGGLG